MWQPRANAADAVAGGVSVWPCVDLNEKEVCGWQLEIAQMVVDRETSLLMRERQPSSTPHLRMSRPTPDFSRGRRRVASARSFVRPNSLFHFLSLIQLSLHTFGSALPALFIGVHTQREADLSQSSQPR